MKQKLMSILDPTTCLSRKQMRDYLAGTLLPEEVHAAEQHIYACPFCNTAIEGFEMDNADSIATIDALDSSFLKTHFKNINPQVHLNSIAPTFSQAEPSKQRRFPIYRVAAACAIILLGIGAYWLYDNNKQQFNADSSLAINTAPQEPEANQTVASEIESKEAPVQAEVQKAEKPSQPSLAEPVAAAPPTKDEDIVEEKKAKTSYASADVAAENSTASDSAMAMPIATTAKMMRSNSDAKSAEGAAASNFESKKDNSEKEQRNIDKRFTEGEKAYKNADYSGALSNFLTAMNSTDAAKASEATYKAALSYRQLGFDSKAVPLLKKLIDNNTSYQNSARKELKSMGIDY